MAITVGNLGIRLLSMAGLSTTGAVTEGIADAILDCVHGAIDEMRSVAPGLFHKHLGGVLGAPAAVTATIGATTPATVSLSAAAPNDGCTIRFAGVTFDATLWDVNGTAATIAPGYAQPITGSVVAAATVYHDAWRVGDGGGSVAEVGSVVRIEGVPLEPVANREQAEGRCGRVAGERMTLSGTVEVPQCWWVERSKLSTLICVYPLPNRRMAIEADLVRGLVEVSVSQVYTSTETFDLPEDHRRLLWLPLAKLRFAGTQFFSNEKARKEIERQGAEARALLEGMRPKKRARRDWNT